MKAVESIDYAEVDFGKNNEHRVEWVAISAKELIYRYGLYTMALICRSKEIADLKRALSAKAIDQVSQLASAIRAKHRLLTTRHNKSLDASGGSAFRN